MAFLLGYCLGIWLIYAALSAILKHTAGLIITTILSLVVGITNLIASGDFMSFIAPIISFVLICTIPPIQVRSKKKTEWRQRRAERKEKNK